jgi:hypothetical protein
VAAVSRLTDPVMVVAAVALASRDQGQVSEQQPEPEPNSNPPEPQPRSVHSLVEEQTVTSCHRSSNSAPVPQAEANSCIRS